jgi:peptidoglycan/xylan/chitin deacetylase (PgdA/CDA1 family)
LPRLYITTSWDDGHPLDLRVADMLVRHGLAATFYVPRSNSRPVLSDVDVRHLSRHFEIGGHTVGHRDLATLSEEESWTEILGCRESLEQITSAACRSFCFPLGHYRRRHVEQVRRAGFHGARTVELMSLASPQLRYALPLMPTTIHAAPARAATYIRNSAKRMRPANLFRYAMVRERDWVGTLENLLSRALVSGGVFHLWGHSWEIEELGQWQNLDRALAIVAQCRNGARYVSNQELWSLAPATGLTRKNRHVSAAEPSATSGGIWDKQ